MGKSILVVEDNPANRKLIRGILETCGYEVVEATDAEECLSVVDNVRPALILMDIQLPATNGLDLTRTLRQRLGEATPPVVGVSAHAMDSDREKAMAAGCCEYVTKPVSYKELIELVVTLTEGPQA